MRNRSKYATIYLVRHRQSKWNVKEILQGQQDSPLTQNGKMQAKELALNLKAIHFDAIFSSDLGRTMQTAGILNAERQMHITATKELRERFFGPLMEGKTEKQYREDLQKEFAFYDKLTDGAKYYHKVTPDTESDDELMQRFIPFVRECAQAYLGRTVLMISHGSLLRTFLIHLGFASRNELPYGALSNSGYIKLRSDGVDFIIDEVMGLNKNPINRGE